MFFFVMALMFCQTLSNFFGIKASYKKNYYLFALFRNVKNLVDSFTF